MSSYEDYNRHAGTYDHTRGPIGVEIIVGCLSDSSVPLPQQVLLDAGCGTGNYSQAMIDYVQNIAAVDLNAAMLTRARSKFSENQQNRIKFYQSGIEQLPFDSQQFDALMVNQVLHHLNDDPASGYPRTLEVLKEFARVLKSGGVLVINICSHEQLAKGFWYSELIPSQVARMQERHVPLPVLERLLEHNGYDYGGRIVPVDALMQGRNYFNARGPLDPTWRSGDSIWSTVSAQQMRLISNRLEELDQRGESEDFMQRCDVVRSEIGQVTFVHARRR